ncbi:DUF6542 domain-containing protein [Parasphingorhabdus pacifica]
MTATRERPNASTPDTGVPAWSDRAAFGTVRGVPLWFAILLPIVTTSLGTGLDIVLWSKPGLLFEALFLLGCVSAVGLARRKNVFGPMVQPPLIAAIVMPVIVLLSGGGSKQGGVTATALAIVQPLINSFPIMAIASGITLGFGLLRLFVLQRAKNRQDAPANSEAPTKKVPAQPKKNGAKPAKRPAPPRERPDEQGKRTERRGNEAPQPDSRQRKPRKDDPRRGDPRKDGPRKDGPRKDAPRKDGSRGGEPRREDPRGGRPAPGRPRPESGSQPPPRGEGRPERPAGRGRPQRPAPGRGRPPEAEPPKRPRRPRRGDSFD